MITTKDVLLTEAVSRLEVVEREVARLRASSLDIEEVSAAVRSIVHQAECAADALKAIESLEVSL